MREGIKIKETWWGMIGCTGSLLRTATNDAGVWWRTTKETDAVLLPPTLQVTARCGFTGWFRSRTLQRSASSDQRRFLAELLRLWWSSDGLVCACSCGSAGGEKVKRCGRLIYESWTEKGKGEGSWNLLRTWWRVDSGEKFVVLRREVCAAWRRKNWGF